MKKLLLISTLLFFAASCNENKERPPTPPDPPIPCPCDETKISEAIQFPQGEAYLFKDSVLEEIDAEVKTGWIILFDSKTDSAWMTLAKNVSELGLPLWGLICNFPDDAKEWDIPSEGCKVYFEGKTFAPSTGGTADKIQFDYLLTNLKRE